MPACRLIALIAAAALAAAPAAAATAAPLPEPAPETADGSGMRGAVVYVLPLLVLIALLIAMTNGGDDAPASP
jgi:hypothetical protein